MDSLSYCSMMTLTEACSSFMLFWALCELLDVDVLLESCWWPLAPGKVPTVPHFQHLYLMALTVVQQSPKALEMALNPVQTDSWDSVS